MARTRSSALALLALLAAAAIVAVAAAAAPEQSIEDDDAAAALSTAGGEEVELTPFSAYDYLAGEWDVNRHIITSSNTLSYAHSLPSVRWKLEKENGTASNNLVGSAWVNGTEQGENGAPIMLRVEMHEPSTGKIQTGVDEDHFNTLAHFQFTQVRSSTPRQSAARRAQRVRTAWQRDVNAHAALRLRHRSRRRAESAHRRLCADR